MSFKNYPDRTSDELKFAREAIANELQYLREKEWRMFSWASSIQLGIIGGVITIAGIRGFLFPLPHRLLFVPTITGNGFRNFDALLVFLNQNRP